MNRPFHHLVVAGLSALALIPAADAAIVVTPDANSLLLWHLNETTGSTFADASGNNRVGSGFDVAPGQIGIGQPGVIDYGVTTGATTGRNFIRNSDLTTTSFSSQSFTLQIWVQNPYLTGADSSLGRVIAAQRTVGSASVDWSLGVMSNGALRVFGNNNGSSISYTSSSLAWSTDVWYNLALVADTQGGITTYSLYRTANNASSLGEVGTFSGYAPGNIGSGAPFAIGGDPGTTTAARRFGGSLDELQYSNIARDQAYLLSSVPEPGTCALAAAGLLLLCHRFRKLRR